MVYNIGLANFVACRQQMYRERPPPPACLSQGGVHIAFKKLLWIIISSNLVCVKKQTFYFVVFLNMHCP